MIGIRKKEKHYTEDQKVHCDKCDKVLLSQLSYKSHIEHFHSKKHVCKMCEQTFDAPKVQFDIFFKWVFI